MTCRLALLTPLCCMSPSLCSLSSISLLSSLPACKYTSHYITLQYLTLHLITLHYTALLQKLSSCQLPAINCQAVQLSTVASLLYPHQDSPVHYLGEVELPFSPKMLSLGQLIKVFSCNIYSNILYSTIQYSTILYSTVL